MAIYHKTYDALYKAIYRNVNHKNTKINSEVSREYLKIETSDAIELCGYIVKPSKSAKGIIIVCHNLGGDKDKAWRYSSFLCEAGYIIVTFDFREHSESKKAKRLIFNRQLDVSAIIKCVYKFNTTNLPIGIFGLSAGATAGIFYAATDKNIRAIVADGGPTLFKEDHLNFIAKNYGIKNPLYVFIFTLLSMLITDAIEIEKRTKRSLFQLKETPILFIQGEKDFFNPPRNIEKALELLNSSKSEYWIVKDAYHLTGFAIAKEEYKERVIAFFEKHLATINMQQKPIIPQ